LVLGAEEADSSQRFTRVVAARRLGDGSLVVVDAGENTITWFEPNGKLRTRAGGTGEGPGEYNALRGLHRLPGDSVLVVDGWSGRVAIYGPDGSLDTSWIPTAPGPFTSVEIAGRTPAGELLGKIERTAASPLEDRRYVMLLMRQGAGDGLDTIGTFPGGESYWEACGPDNGGMCNIGVPYGLRSSAAVTGEVLAVANGERAEIALFRADSGQVGSWRLAPRSIPLSAARHASWIDSVLAPYPADRSQAARERFTRAPVRTVMPEIEALLTDPQGVLWVARPLTEGAGEREWELLGPDGAHRGRVMVPAGLRVTDVGHGYLTGVELDEDGRELVVSHGLVAGK
jgi:hypothetical protein